MMVVIRCDRFLQGAGKGRNSKVRRAVKVYSDVVERGGHPDEVYEPKNGFARAIQSEVGQLWEDEGDRGLWCPRQGYRSLIQVQLSKIRMPLEDL